MTKKSQVYTKGGDKGQTSLVGGERVSKGNERIELYGDVDELNSFVGLAHSLSVDLAETSYLQTIQKELFDIGSNFACLATDREKYKLPQVSASNIEMLEREIDKHDSLLEPLKNFVLPGGSQLAATLHICRTVTRRVERKAVSFNEQMTGDISEDILKYFNRLSDYFFVLARTANRISGISEPIWQPEKN